MLWDWLESLHTAHVEADHEAFARRQGGCDGVQVLGESSDLPEVGKQTNGDESFRILENEPVQLLVCWEISVAEVKLHLARETGSNENLYSSACPL